MSLLLEERIKKGYFWYFVIVSCFGYVLGERVFVMVEIFKLDGFY